MENKITTYTKIRMNPINPKIEDIDIRDIAHALSLMTRGNGQITYFFSVAQHSINCYIEAKNRGYSPAVQLASLLHDASESYLSDITRPVKRKLDKYREIESNVQKIIYIKYLGRELTKDEEELVTDIDNAMLVYELYILLDTKIKTDSTLTHIPNLDQKDMEDVEQQFLDIFNDLVNK